MLPAKGLIDAVHFTPDTGDGWSSATPADEKFITHHPHILFHFPTAENVLLTWVVQYSS